MEFWGVEVKPGELLNCDPGDDKYLHISQAALGDIQNPKGNERVPLYVHVDNKKLVIGTLVFGKCDQLALDLVFDREFQLSHSCTSGSVFFSGYYTAGLGSEDGEDGMEMGEDDTDSDSEDERQALALMSRVKNNGQTEAKPVKPVLKKEGTKPAKSEPVMTGKAVTKVTPAGAKPTSVQKPGEGEKSSDDDDSDDEEDSSDDGSGDSEGESDDGKNKKTPMVEAAGKKRPLPNSATKTRGITDKKAKTPVPGGAQKPGIDGGKKDGAKTPVGPYAPVSKGQKSQTPKAKGTPVPKETPKTPTTPGSGSGKKIGAHLCAPCSRNFATESALTQHNAAKHGGKQG